MLTHALAYSYVMANGGDEPDPEDDLLPDLYAYAYKKGFYQRNNGIYEKGTAKSVKDFHDITGFKNIKDFFDQGAVELQLTENNILTFRRPFGGDIVTKFVAIGPYKAVTKMLEGPLQLDESSQSEVIFLAKYLGNYDIDKINSKFLIRNGDQAIVLEKHRW